ncbi:MAG TPA: daunorubicin/doxorubicin resistance ABC transporter ATP-binding protein DrrA, partial [Acidimicrobiales bacterium]|nr:daunorubicin/doxorubicin resistance ABC transporter ATP-binding protein DrrA [Acidimicrobiales bacterium]
LTTQYLEEADRLAHRIVVIDGGRVIAEGTADQLKGQMGGARVEARLTNRADVERVLTLIADLGDGPAEVDPVQHRVSLPTRGGAKVLLAAGRRLEDHGIALDDLGIRRPSLDDVFLTLTGHVATDESLAS